MDIEGVFESVRICLQTKDWLLFWESLNIPILGLSDVGLDRRSTDATIWRVCQENQLVLITGNRNQDDPTSLESTIQNENGPECLPVLTIADPQRLRYSAAYVALVTERLLERLLEIDQLLGTGRLYLP